MTGVWVGLGVLLAAVVAFIWWRWTSVERGARQRDEKIIRALDPLREKLNQKQSVTVEEVQALADTRQFRPLLYSLLEYLDRLELFPERYLDSRSQAESILAYWMMHPNELQDIPRELELVEIVRRPIADEKLDFFVFRYKMAPGHWAMTDDCWLLGLAGPFFDNDTPYSAGAFSRCGDKHGEVQPGELVDWYIGMVHGKVAEKDWPGESPSIEPTVGDD
jgi:hypothetical protein